MGLQAQGEVTEYLVIDSSTNDSEEVVTVTKQAGKAPVYDFISKRKKKKYWTELSSKVIAGIFALGTGINAVVALSTLIAGWPFFLIASALFLCAIYANYHMCKKDVSTLLLDGVKNLFKTKDGKNLSRKKIVLLSAGIVMAALFGLTLGALTWASTYGLAIKLIFLTALSSAFPPLGILLGSITFICLTALMIKAFSDLIKTEDLSGKIKTICKAIILRDPIRDKDKSATRVFLERAFVVTTLTLLAGATLGLIFWGQVLTLSSCAHGLSDILLKATQGSVAAINIASRVIANGCAMLAQVPFILKTALIPLVGIFTKSSTQMSIANDQLGAVDAAYEEMEDANTIPHKGHKMMLAIASVFNAGASGVISLSALGVMSVVAVLGAIGGFLNSFCATFGNAVAGEFISEKKQASSTAIITNELNFTSPQKKTLSRSFSMDNMNSAAQQFSAKKNKSYPNVNLFSEVKERSPSPSLNKNEECASATIPRSQTFT